MPLEVVFWDTCSSNIRNWFHMLNITKPKAWAKLRTKNYIPFAHLPFHQQQFLQHLSQVSMGPAPVYRVTSGKKIQKSDYVFFGEIPSHIYIRQMEVKRIFGRLLRFKTFWVNWWTLFKPHPPAELLKKRNLEQGTALRAKSVNSWFSKWSQIDPIWNMFAHVADCSHRFWGAKHWKTCHTVPTKKHISLENFENFWLTWQNIALATIVCFRSPKNQACPRFFAKF